MSSGGPLPPVPDLIPISALRRASLSSAASSSRKRSGRRAAEAAEKRLRHSSYSSGASSSCSSSRSCTVVEAVEKKEVMGEQRSRRTANKPADLIDSAGSRGLSAAPQPPQSRKVRSERHRKSDRRREHRKPARTKSGSSKHNNNNNNNRSRSSSRRSSSHLTTNVVVAAAATDKVSSSPERPANPRVNPIFVFIRQVDTRIVEVKCEDYDKRNRLVLTKTAQGWRAIPRTDTFVPSLKDPLKKKTKSPHRRHHHHHRHHHKSKKSKRTKCRKRSTAVQVSEVDVQTSEPEEEVKDNEPGQEGKEDLNWMNPVNIESLLPSHKILIKKPIPDLSLDLQTSNVNIAVDSDNTQTQTKCSADQINDVSPLDNLLAVAELEFNQQIQSDEWSTTVQHDLLDNQHEHVQDDNEDYALKTFEESMDDTSKQYMEQLNNLIEACTSKVEKTEENEEDVDFLGAVVKKSDECDYNDDEDNNLAMDDILTRLEQSLRSPECTEINKMASLADAAANAKPVSTAKMRCIESDINENNYKSVPELETFFVEELKSEKLDEVIELKDSDGDNDNENQKEESIIPQEELPTDLTVKNKAKSKILENFDEPTDLSVPKKIFSPPPLLTIPRSPSQNSEAIQSPQPSGIPAVPQSPDLSQSCSASNKKAMFLESLLTTNSLKIPLNSEVTIIRQKEPLDLGKSRKSASPTVTCSEEVNIETECMEPPAKKFKPEDITLKNLLDAESGSAEMASNNKGEEKLAIPDTPRLLELLKNDIEPDPITQLKQVLSDSTIQVPNPLLIPKERLDAIILHPGKEIPKLIKQRPELRLPDVLTHEHLSHNPDILVIKLDQLETIVAKQYYSEKKEKSSQAKQSSSVPEKEKSQKIVDITKSPLLKKSKSYDTTPSKSSETQTKSSNLNLNELANDIDAATTAAFNQIMWLPYLNQLEAMQSYGGNNPQDFMKMFNNQMPFYPGQMHDMPNMSNIPNMNMANMANMFMNNNNRFPSPMNFPMQPPVNFNNPLEMSMWQEAMMQANMLRPKMPFEGMNQQKTNNNNIREYMEKMNTKKQQHSSSRFHSNVNKTHGGGFFPGSSNGHPGYQNQFISHQPRHNLPVPPFNQMMAQQQQQKAMLSQQQKHDYTKKSSQNFNNYYSSLAQEKQKHHQQQQQQQQQQQRGKVSCRPFANSKPDPPSRLTGQPMDLSGSTVTGSGKLKVKQHLIDPANAPRLLKHHEDVAEVGSTTASVEDMQEAHKHLWHPLFGNQKGYNSPWNWTTVTATGE